MRKSKVKVPKNSPAPPLTEKDKHTRSQTEFYDKPQLKRNLFANRKLRRSKDQFIVAVRSGKFKRSMEFRGVACVGPGPPSQYRRYPLRCHHSWQLFAAEGKRVHRSNGELRSKTRTDLWPPASAYLGLA